MNNTSVVNSSRTKTIIIGIVIAVLIAIALFVAGFLKGRAPIAGLQAQLMQTQAQLVVSQNHSYLVEADAALYHTATDLDQRNFGTGNNRLKEAAVALGNVKQDSSNIDMNGITQLRTSIIAMNINVAVNLEDQRAQVLKFATQVDGLIGK